MEWYYIVLIVVASLLVLYVVLDFIVAFFIVNTIMHPSCRTIEQIIQYETSDTKKITFHEFFEEFKMTDFVIKSKYGYNLQATYLKPVKEVEFSDGKKRVAIMVHGWTSNRYAMLGYGRIYSTLGFHVYIYDHRNHFRSDRALTTMGHYEAEDLETVIEYVKKEQGDNIVIGTHGESMGSATVMTHIGRYHNLDFVCEDCGYATLKELLKYQCEVINHLPSFPTLIFGDFFFHVLAKSSYKNVNCLESLKKCEDIPMYFIHGAADAFVPTKYVYKLYDAKPGFKEITIYEGAEHARSLGTHKEEYYKNLTKFLQDAKII